MLVVAELADPLPFASSGAKLRRASTGFSEPASAIGAIGTAEIAPNDVTRRHSLMALAVLLLDLSDRLSFLCPFVAFWSSTPLEPNSTQITLHAAYGTPM